jgi:TM2 domain-containing membrane protein YozV
MPFCPQCGTGNPDGARFCQSCGTAIPVVGSPPPAGAASPPAGQAGPGLAPPPQPRYAQPSQPGYGGPGYPPPGGYAAPARRKNPGAAAALGLLWGFGAQAFYNGQPIKAVVQIVLNVIIMWPMLRALGPMAWGVGLAVAAIFMVDGYKVAQKINTGVPVGPWTSF